MAKSFVISDNPGWVEELKRRFSTNKRVLVGFPEETKGRKEGQLTNAYIASIHEFGSPMQGIPERSFLRSSVRNNQKKYNQLNKVNLKRVANGQMSIDQALDLFGIMAEGDVKQNIRHGTYTPLKASTIQRKGSSRPLIDTGQLVQAVKHVVEDKE
jgi:hypothetical protein